MSKSSSDMLIVMIPILYERLSTKLPYLRKASCLRTLGVLQSLHLHKIHIKGT